MLLPLHLNLAAGGGGSDDFETPIRDANYRHRFGGLWALVLPVLVTGCTTITEIKEIECDTIEFFPPNTTSATADSAVYRGCEPPEWDGLIVRFRR